MTKKEIALEAVKALKEEYPDALCSLHADNPLELLIATRLSAQCTDARVNLVTPALFAKYPTLEDYCSAQVEDVEQLIHSCGFYHGKARDIIAMAQKIRDDFGGKVPLGLVATKDPYKVEMALKKLLPPEESNDFCHRAVLHGRAVCTARKANCEACCMQSFCKKKI